MREDGRAGACSLVPGPDGKGGCPAPLHDVDVERDRIPAPELAAITLRLAHARAKHPDGASFDALVEEVGEVARARLERQPDQEREELLDVAVVAMRLYLGERAP